MKWDPGQYARYREERSRPFLELVARIETEAPASVLDIGCGSGELTALLARRWPQAWVRGIDGSAEMIERAPRDVGVDFALGDAREASAAGVDVLVANAVLQWIPDHTRLLVRWARELSPGGCIAFQVPANFGAPSHVLMRELADSPRWCERLAGVLRGVESVAAPARYLDLLAHEGLRVDAWQTEYQHVLEGRDPVLAWVRGTGLRPVLAVLDEDEAGEFARSYAALLREAYPEREYGTVFPFRRTFVVAHRPWPGSGPSGPDPQRPVS
jgi:trans-aconitate 2-methyltransferase